VLRQLLSGLPTVADPNLLVGSKTADDAGVYKISDDLALVQTVDFFTPIVDDPYTYGQIAAANALSDVYAMGGKPLTALNICAFPADFPIKPLQEILRGGQEKTIEAGVAVVGGHTIQDKELKYGMSITGTIHPDKIYTNAGAKPGDALILTKPIGTGILTTAIKKRKASDQTIERVCYWMAYLNKSAAEVLSKYEVHACTDITGFGLAGHGSHIAKESHVGLKICLSDLPHYEEAITFVKKGYLTGADQVNREYTKAYVEKGPDIPKELESLFYDPQTSGGLLVSVNKTDADQILKDFFAVGLNEARIIGEVFASDTPKLKLYI